MKTPQKTIYVLLKIAKSEHAEMFRAGIMHMNLLRYFRELKNEAGELIGDPYEGLSVVLQPSQIKRVVVRGYTEGPQGAKVYLPDAQIELPTAELAGPLLGYLEGVQDLNAFCMYAVHSGEFRSISEENLEEFTQYLRIEADKIGLGPDKKVVVVEDGRAFLDRIELACARERIAIRKAKLMSYFDITEFHGLIDDPGFHKTNDYSAQREWRLVAHILDDGTREFDEFGAYNLHIGSIEDITSIMTIEEFNETVQALLPDAEDAEGS